MQTPRKLRERKRQQDLLNDSINSYNSISLNKPINASNESNLTNTLEVESPTGFIGNEGKWYWNIINKYYYNEINNLLNFWKNFN